jgi:hypothetical protein
MPPGSLDKGADDVKGNICYCLPSRETPVEA